MCHPVIITFSWAAQNLGTHRNLDCLICDDPLNLGPFASTAGYINNSYCFDADDMAEPMVKRCHDGEYNITVDDIEGATSLALWDRGPLDLVEVEALFDTTKDDRRPSRLCNPDQVYLAYRFRQSSIF